MVAQLLGEKLAAHEMVALALAASLAIAGLILARIDPKRENVEAWLQREPETQPKYDLVIPGPVLGAIALIGLVAISVFGCYLYYPPPAEIFEEMRLINGEVVTAATSQDWDTALYWIPIYDDWTRKLQVSVVLRGGELSDYRRMKADVFRDKLELLEHELEDHEIEPAREMGLAVNRAYRRLRVAYDD
jgi:hypothetical protein